MISLQCVGSVCRSRKRASYLQGGSEMIMRKNNNRKTKSSGRGALFPRVFSHFCILHQILIRVHWIWERWGLSVSAAYRSSAPEALFPPNLPAGDHHPRPLRTHHRKAHSHGVLVCSGVHLKSLELSQNRVRFRHTGSVGDGMCGRSRTRRKHSV